MTDKPNPKAIVVHGSPLAKPDAPRVEVLENAAELFIGRIVLDGAELPGVAIHVVAGSATEAQAWLREILRPSVRVHLGSLKDIARKKKR